MRLSLRSFLFISFSILIHSPLIMAKKNCVISFLDPVTKEGKMIQTVFQHDINTTILDRPSLTQLRQCLSEDYDEILWVAHGYYLKQNDQWVSHPYYLSLSGTKSPMYRDYFKNLANKITSGEIKFKRNAKLRIAICGVNQKTPNSMMDLLNALEQQQIELDFSPVNEFFSLSSRPSLTTLNLAWLAKSIDRSQLKVWRTNGNYYCKDDWWPNCDRQDALYAIPRHE